MLEGLHPVSPTHLMRLETSEKAARRVADIVSETFDPAETAVAAFEAPDGRIWLVEVFFREEPDEANVRELVRVAAGEAVAACLTFHAIESKDWVRTSLDGLKPVQAGRFTVFGSHDRDKVAPNAIPIEIEAALAFGTGHHGTTLGCLRAIDRLAKARRSFRPLDVGTGTGVLAIAAGLRNRVSMLASDIDLVSVIAARENAVLNKARTYVHAIHAAGLKDARFRRGGSYDLILANILPRPLVGLSTDLCRLVAPGGTVILSGIIPPHANLVISAYRSRGLRLVMREEIEGWVTLTMRRGR
ncbi:MAG: 50S ribosomal protein L11 methyltransferase [Phreatobacter sp.]|uniref:50S ribosomal protein L11 methyltransferase n=1 Tax=Phreatobacter sp. TaxID=1966341 RepID=UPI001A60FB5B|nr:50S ribosomal protein L11 methyltransferase [Phreatobacter sp.]MBL8570375.1 50S ribosomal protein L11 methyltransferase [Phreatobacter sp.]